MAVVVRDQLTVYGNRQQLEEKRGQVYLLRFRVGGEILAVFCIFAAGKHCAHDRRPGHGQPPGPLRI